MRLVKGDTPKNGGFNFSRIGESGSNEYSFERPRPLLDNSVSRIGIRLFSIWGKPGVQE